MGNEEYDNNTLYDCVEQDVCDPTKNWDDVIRHIEDMRTGN